MAEFSDVGGHCISCGAQDFLPFRCDACLTTLCASCWGAHRCAAAEAKDRRSAACPLCAASILWTAGDDLDALWHAHYASGACTGASAAQGEGEGAGAGAGAGAGRPKVKVRCVAQGCREGVLGPSNRFQCKQCRRVTCLGHRAPEDHGCVEGRRQREARAAEARLAAQRRRAEVKEVEERRKREATARTAQERKRERQRKQREAERGPNSVRGTAERRAQERQQQQQQQQQQQSQHQQEVVTSNEPCPHCGQLFADATELVMHVSSVHQDAPGGEHAIPVDTAAPSVRPAQPAAAPSGSGSSTPHGSVGSGGGTEPCPFCGARFPDPMDLLAHVTAEHDEQQQQQQHQQQQPPHSDQPPPQPGAPQRQGSDCCVS